MVDGSLWSNRADCDIAPLKQARRAFPSLDWRAAFFISKNYFVYFCIHHRFTTGSPSVERRNPPTGTSA